MPFARISTGKLRKHSDTLFLGCAAGVFVGWVGLVVVFASGVMLPRADSASNLTKATSHGAASRTEIRPAELKAADAGLAGPIAETAERRLAAPTFTHMRLSKETGQGLFAGRGEPGARVVLMRGGKPMADVEVDEDGNWQLATAVVPMAGTHRFALEQRSRHGYTVGDNVEMIVPEGHARTIDVTAPDVGEGFRLAAVRADGDDIGSASSRRFDQFFKNKEDNRTDQRGRQNSNETRVANKNNDFLTPAWSWLRDANRSYNDEILPRIKRGGGFGRANENTRRSSGQNQERRQPRQRDDSQDTPRRIANGDRGIVSGVSDWLSTARRGYNKEIVPRLSGEVPPVIVARPNEDETNSAERERQQQARAQNLREAEQEREDAERRRKDAERRRVEAQQDAERIAAEARRAREERRLAQAEEARKLEEERQRVLERRKAEEAAERQKLAEAAALRQAEAERREAERKRLAEAERAEKDRADQAQFARERAERERAKAEQERQRLARLERERDEEDARRRRAAEREESERLARVRREEQQRQDRLSAEAEELKRRQVEIARRAREEAERRRERETEARRQRLARATPPKESPRFEQRERDTESSERGPDTRFARRPKDGNRYVQRDTSIWFRPARERVENDSGSKERESERRVAQRRDSSSHYTQRETTIKFNAAPPVVKRRAASSKRRRHAKAARRTASLRRRARRIRRRIATRSSRCHHRAGRRISPPGTYVVRRGDSLWKISRRHYRLGRLFRRIHRANRGKIDRPSLIYPCQRFHLPRSRRS